jgi:2-polyprenyl-3-methyl-5-hydroxy-6-metoxy-1,4-benzoquinol methylase
MKGDKHPSVLTHHHPDWLLERPHLLKIIHSIHYLTQLRNWYVRSSLSDLLKKVPAKYRLLDAGCGEGQYLFSYAKRYPAFHFTGIDKIEQNITLCQGYISKTKLKNVTVLHTSIESMDTDEKYNAIICVGVLQYIEKDREAVNMLYNSLAENGRLLLYTPVNDRIILPFYKKILAKYPGYETVQGRKRIYCEDSIQILLQNAKFSIRSRKQTYGFLGTLSNELFNSLILMMIHLPFVLRILAGLLFVLLYPLILLCMLLDFLLPVRYGNGLLLIAEKNSR